ncbi:MAG: T9SS type A sorting domain-containing protein, partial [Bacteroidota bacterium]
GVFGTDTLNQTGFSLQDVFVAEVDSTGQMLGAFNIPGNGDNDESYCITTDSADNIYIGGAYDLSITINGVTQFCAGGYTDGFIVKYGSICVTGVEENNTANNTITIYPNPASSFLTINSTTLFNRIAISSITGQELINTNYINGQEARINISELTTGIYIVTVYGKEGIVNGKLVVE